MNLPFFMLVKHSSDLFWPKKTLLRLCYADENWKRTQQWCSESFSFPYVASEWSLHNWDVGIAVRAQTKEWCSRVSQTLQPFRGVKRQNHKVNHITNGAKRGAEDGVKRGEPNEQEEKQGESWTIAPMSWHGCALYLAGAWGVGGSGQFGHSSRR